jgi:hypothetical protein
MFSRSIASTAYARREYALRISRLRLLLRVGVRRGHEATAYGRHDLANRECRQEHYVIVTNATRVCLIHPST